MTAPQFRAWMERLGYTLDAAAAALDIGRSTIARYRAGQWPIPRVVALACAHLAKDRRSSQEPVNRRPAIAR